MDLTQQIFSAQVMHKRLFPKVNAFHYRVYYLAIPLPAVPLPSRVLRFENCDHGAHDGTDCAEWARNILREYGMSALATHIMLITMPRVLGYVFNPVSFYFCMDDELHLRAVICEVHNTFGEHHSYICARSDLAPIPSDEWLSAQKVFHVSPFLERKGSYRFRFSVTGETLGIWIDFYDEEGRKQLITSLTGKLSPLNRSSLSAAFWTHPLVTLKSIALIHWQAAKLVLKGIRYISKPLQLLEKISSTSELTKK